MGSEQIVSEIIAWLDQASPNSSSLSGNVSLLVDWTSFWARELAQPRRIAQFQDDIQSHLASHLLNQVSNNCIYRRRFKSSEVLFIDLRYNKLLTEIHITVSKMYLEGSHLFLV